MLIRRIVWCAAAVCAALFSASASVNPVTFAGNDSERIERAISAACDGRERMVTIPAKADGRAWSLDRAILLPDDFTLVLDNCTLTLAPGVQDNLIRNIGAVPNAFVTNRNIRVIGKGRAVLYGGDEPHFDPPGDKCGWRTIGVLLCAVEGFELRGFTVRESHAWGISLEHGTCYGRVSDITFENTNRYPNQDGVDVRKGCHDIVIENISGVVGDDAVALTGIRRASRRPPETPIPQTAEEKARVFADKRKLSMQIGGDGVREGDDIHDITIRHVHAKCVGGHGIVRLLCQDGIKLYRVTVTDVVDTAGPADARVQAAVRIGDTGFASARRATSGDMYAVRVDGVTTPGKVGVWVKGPLENSTIVNVKVTAKDAKKLEVTAPTDRLRTDDRYPRVARMIRPDAPSGVVRETERIVLRLSCPDETTDYVVTDWRGRICASGRWPFHGRLVLEPLPVGYYTVTARSGADEVWSSVTVVPRARPKKRHPFFGAMTMVSDRKWGKLSFSWSDGDQGRHISELVRRAGVANVREIFRWGEAAASGTNDYSFLRSMSKSLAQRGGADVLMCFGGTSPAWTHPRGPCCMPDDLAALCASAEGAARAAGEAVSAWSFWNEEDLTYFTPNPAWEYAAALKAASVGFRRAKPNVTVMPGALCQALPNAFARSLFANGLAKYVDGFNYHIYAAPNAYPRILGGARRMMDEAGLGGKALWITECGTDQEGASRGRSCHPDLRALDAEQEMVYAEHYPKTQVYYMMEGVARNYQFTLAANVDRRGEKDWGMLRRDGVARPAYAAMSTMTFELADARLLGEMRLDKDVKTFLFEQPNGSQVLVFWTFTKLDRGWYPVRIESQEEKPLTLSVADGRYRLADFCGTPSSVEACGGRLELVAVRYPHYLSGLSGLKAEVAPLPAGRPMRAPVSTDEDLAVVIRPQVDTNDFTLGMQRSMAEMHVEHGRLRLDVWNLGAREKRGKLVATGASVRGLPEVVTIPPMGRVTLPVTVEPSAGSGGEATVSFGGTFDGRRVSCAAVPMRFERRLLETLRPEPLSVGDAARWSRRDDARSYELKPQGCGFALSAEWVPDGPVQHWIRAYCKLDAGTFVGVKLVEFEIKAEQDKIENDFDGVMFAVQHANGSAEVLPFVAPNRSWETRRVSVAADDAVAIGFRFNPLGRKLKLSVRNLRVYR